MSEFLDEIEKRTFERITNGDSIDKQFWYIFSYCKGMERVVDSLGQLGKIKIEDIESNIKKFQVDE